MSDKGTCNIVIAEGLALFRDGLSALCELTGRFTVCGKTSDGAEALSLIEQHRPDLAVIDLHIAGIDCLEIAKRLTEDEYGVRALPTRCIVLGVRTDRKTVIEALRAGALGYILKSSTGEQWLDCLQQVHDGGIYVSPAVDVQGLFSPDHRDFADDPLSLLSPREFQVFTLLVEGIRGKEIAARLQLSPKTIDTYRSSLMDKLDIYDVPGLVKYAIQRRLIYA